MGTRPVDNVTKLCGHSIRELARSAKPGDSNLLNVLFGVLCSNIGTPEERDEALDSLFNAARAGDVNALRRCLDLVMPSSSNSAGVAGKHILDKLSGFFIQLAQEGRLEALIALKTTVDVLRVEDKQEAKAPFRKLILSLIGREIPVKTQGLFEFVERLAPEEQIDFMKSLVKLARGGSGTALHTLRDICDMTSICNGNKSRICFSEFLKKLVENNCPAALNLDIRPDQKMISAGDWLDTFKCTGEDWLCNVEYLTKDASTEQIEQILLASLTSKSKDFVPKMLQTDPQKVVSALEKLANAGDSTAMVALGCFFLKNPATTREAVQLLLRAVKLGGERARERISCIKHSDEYKEKAKLVNEILLEQASIGDYQAEANILLGYLTFSERDDNFFSLLLKADELGKDVSLYVGLHLLKTHSLPIAEPLNYLRRKTEAGSLDAKFFLGLHTQNPNNPLAYNESAGLVMEALINSHTDYSEYLRGFRIADADASPELAVLCGMSKLHLPASRSLFRTESHYELALVDFSAAFDEE
jgi:hypothetical protein